MPPNSKKLLKKRKNIYTRGGLSQNPQKLKIKENKNKRATISVKLLARVSGIAKSQHHQQHGFDFHQIHQNHQ
jgi:hypothetical protein